MGSMEKGVCDGAVDSDSTELCQRMESLTSGSMRRTSADGTVAIEAGPARGPKKAKAASVAKAPAASSRPKTPVSSCATPVPADSSALETSWVRFTLEKDDELKKENRKCGPLYYCLAGPSSVVVRQVSVPSLPSPQ